MKQLQLHTPQYQYLIKSYSQWLQTMGYAQVTIKSFPIHVQEYLHHLEIHQGITHIKDIKRVQTDTYIQYLDQRANQTRGGGLSDYHINKQIVAINTFHKYLLQVREINLPFISKATRKAQNNRSILSVNEIKQLYQATHYQSRENSKAMGQRDRAILALLYASGLRKKEAIQLNLTDVDLNKGQLHIKHTKNKRERLVPLIPKAQEHIEEYIHQARHWFTLSHRTIYHRDRAKTNPDHQALIIGQKGTRLDHGYYHRLKALKKRAGITLEITPHTLRHSIATHLLAGGMPIEDIKDFLGHRSLESTQIYTHIAHNYEQLDQLTNA